MARKIPLGINIISIIILISGIVSLLAGVVMLGLYFATPVIPDGLSFMTYLSPVILILGIILMIFAIFRFIVFSALRKGRKWAYVLVLVIEILSLLVALINIIMGNYAVTLSLLISAIIVSYLIFSKKVRRYYNV